MMPNKKDIKVSCFLAEWYFTYIHFFWIKNLQCKLGSFLCFVGFKCQGTTKFSETGQKIAFDCQIIPYHRKPFSSVMFLAGQDGSLPIGMAWRVTWSGQRNPGRTGSGKNRRKPAQNCHFWLFFGVVRILGAADEISKNILESPFQELSNNSSTVPGRRPGGTY